MACLQHALWVATGRTVPAWRCVVKGHRMIPSLADVCAHQADRGRTVDKVGCVCVCVCVCLWGLA